jgi:glycosyltransferase involved in cell wall biosynthesis
MSLQTAEYKKLVITILSDAPFLPTGYSNQSKQLADYLVKKGHDVHYLANAYNGNTLVQAKLIDGTEFNYKIYGEMVHSYFMNTLSQHLKETKTDILFILLDTFMLYPHLLNVDLSPAKSVFFFPSDGGGGMPKNCDNILRKVDKAIAMAKFGQKQVKDYYNMDVQHIPHGLNIERFNRLNDDDRAKLRLKWGLNDKFVVGVVARNQPRKMLDRTFKAMHFIKDKIPNAILFLHLDPNDPAGQMFNMGSMIQRYGLENRVAFSGMQAHKGFDWDKMNEVYNLMDCFLLTTSGEGFGIPIIEAMACEVPVIATDYTTTPELVKENNAGLGIKLAGCEEITWQEFFGTDSKYYDNKMVNGTLTGSWEVERGLCDCKDAADKVEFIYKNPELAKQMGKNGRKAVLEKYDFKLVAEQFDKLFQELA